MVLVSRAGLAAASFAAFCLFWTPAAPAGAGATVAPAGAGQPVVRPDPGTPPPDPVPIHVYVGGAVPCPPGGARASLSPDNTALAMAYGPLVVGVGEGFPPPTYRRDCRVSVLVYVPDGYRFAVTQVRQRGYADLAAGVLARTRHTYYFDGEPTGPVWSHELTGPFSGGWEFVDEEPEPRFSPCGDLRYLNTDRDVRVRAPAGVTATSFVDMTGSEADPSVVFHLTWRRCAEPS